MVEKMLQLLRLLISRHLNAIVTLVQSNDFRMSLWSTFLILIPYLEHSTAKYVWCMECKGPRISEHRHKVLTMDLRQVEKARLSAFSSCMKICGESG